MSQEIFTLEQKIVDQLSLLKNKFSLLAIKAEFESEGASFRDLVKLRRLTAQQNISLYLKIGGVEALRDLKDAFDLGVDGLIAPMVESPFGVIKFLSSIDSIFGQKKLFISINIETKNAIANIDNILEVSQKKVNNITVGRTDLSRSYLDSSIQPDSPFIFNLIDQLSTKVNASGFTFTVGGSLTLNSIELLQNRKEKLEKKITSIETRKVILSSDQMLADKYALKESIYFEELYLKHKLECESWFSEIDQQRLKNLKTRL
jgi:2-keto-3-deoxy-L-rhamnonate aldolase RhmA